MSCLDEYKNVAIWQGHSKDVAVNGGDDYYERRGVVNYNNGTTTCSV